MFKWIGAILIVLGCGGYGCLLALSHRNTIKSLSQFLRILDIMENELEFRLPALSPLCRRAAQQGSGCVKMVLLSFAEELDRQVAPDAGLCMAAAVAKYPDLPPQLGKILVELGAEFGSFGLEGQLRSLKRVRSLCQSELKMMSENSDSQIRCYQTLSLCAGAAAAIIFL